MESTEFFLTISSNLCSNSDDLSDDSYQILVAHKVCEHVKYALEKQNKLIDHPNSNVLPQLKPCCPTQSDKNEAIENANHSTHYVSIQVPTVWLRQCAIYFRPDLSVNKKELEDSLLHLTPAQTAWLAKLALGTLTFSKADWSNLSHDVNLPFKVEEDIVRRIETNQSCLFLLGQSNLCGDELVLGHDKQIRRQLWSQCWTCASLFPDANVIRSYFGDDVGFYFTWMKSYCLYLLIGSLILGSTCSCLQWYDSGKYANESALIYSVTMILWSVFCSKLWMRQYATCVDQWATNDMIELMANQFGWLFQIVDQRPDFHGFWRQSHITGQMELHYSAAKRRVRCVVSFGITMLCLVFAGWINVLSLNFQGLISPIKTPWLYVHVFSQFSQPGAFFDPNYFGVASFVPAMLHSVIISALNEIFYYPVAKMLTKWENHKTNKDFGQALILKRFLFEVIDAYGSLIYLAFVLTDREAFKITMLTWFATDSIRRIFVECVLPYVTYRLRLHQEHVQVGKQKRSADQTDKSNTLYLIKESSRDAYNQFDDYLEMILQHGYIVLFAFVSPHWVPIFAALCTFIESHADAFKLFWINQRVRPKLLVGKSSIWLGLLAAQTWLAVISNAGLWVTQMAPNDESDFSAMFWFVVFEHAVLLVALAIQFGIADVPAAVRDARQARECRQSRLFLDKKV